MIIEEIAAAKQAKRQRLLIGIGIVVVLSCLALALLYGASHFSLSRFSHTTPETTQPAAVDPAPVPSGTDEELRKAYLDAFSRYENELKPALAEIDINSWDPSRADALQQQEEQAVTAFGNSNYPKAVQAINSLINTAEATLADSKVAFEQAMEQAQTGYDELDYAAAKLAIDTALIHNAASAEAQELAAKIEKIPAIVDLTDAINTARVENDKNKELSLINQLLEITPDDEDLQQRAQQLRTQLTESQFNSAIAQANQAIAQRNINQAEKSVQQAKQLYPSRSETKQVAQALSQLQSQIRFEQHTSLASAAKTADNWEKVEQELTLALKEKPSDKATTEQLTTAKRIVTVKQEMAALLQSPYRLSNASIKANATETLRQTDSLISQSPSLSKQAQQLRSTLTAANTPVAVEVMSDGKTHVSVRGVGIVGEITSRIIQLPPGNYTFEGKRNGYKSKLLEVQIPLNKSSYQLRIVADERI